MGDKIPPIPKPSPWKKAINFAKFVRTNGKVSLVDASIWANMEIPWFNRVIAPYMNKFEDIYFDGKFYICKSQDMITAPAPEQASVVAPAQAVQQAGGP